MNIYELEKQATPGPWEVGEEPDGSLHTARFLRQAVPFNKFGGKHRVTGSYEFEGSRTGTHSGPWVGVEDARLAVHCRNNFMRALDWMKRYQQHQSCDQLDDLNIELDPLIAELEAVE